jgi:hypothetical protein
MAYLTPIPPAEWLLNAVGEVVEHFAERFHTHHRANLRALPNFNLDTGRIEIPPITHTGTLNALTLLGRWRGGSPVESWTSPPEPYGGPRYPGLLRSAAVSRAN